MKRISRILTHRVETSSCQFRKSARRRLHLRLLGPYELSLQCLWVYCFPVELCFVRPSLVGAWVNVVAQACVEVVVSGLFLEFHVKLQFGDALLQACGLFLCLDVFRREFCEMYLLLFEAGFPCLRGCSFVVAPYRCVEVRQSGVVEFEERRV